MFPFFLLFVFCLFVFCFTLFRFVHPAKVTPKDLSPPDPCPSCAGGWRSEYWEGLGCCLIRSLFVSQPSIVWSKNCCLWSVFEAKDLQGQPAQWHLVTDLGADGGMRVSRWIDVGVDTKAFNTPSRDTHVRCVLLSFHWQSIWLHWGYMIAIAYMWTAGFCA